jgi:hypothetical protein
MSQSRSGSWGHGLVPMTVLVPEGSHPGMMGQPTDGATLGALYEEAMARFDAFCFWYGKPARSVAGMREVAKRLEAYGSPEALRLAREVREALGS